MRPRCSVPVAMLLAATSVLGSTADPQGQPITRIQIRSDAPPSAAEQLLELLDMKVGDSFSPSAAARSLRNLQASGLVSEIELHTEVTEPGVEVTLAAWGRVQVREVRLEGELALKRRELLRVLEVREGEPLIESRILRGKIDLEQLYEGRGYLEAAVRARPRVDHAAKVAQVVYEIDAGRQFFVRSIELQGSLGPFTSESLIGRLEMTEGKTFRQRLMRAEVERLESWLIGQGYRLCSFDQPRVATDWDAARVDLIYPLEVGPLFHIEIKGAEIRRLQKKDLLPVLGSQRYDEALMLQSVERVRRYFQELGHYDVVVDFSETQSEELVHIALAIEPGPVFELEEVSFIGNEAVSSRQLAALMAISPKRVLTRGSGRLVDAQLADDLANIEAFYRLSGYWDARTGPAEVTREGQSLSLTISIEEGRQRRVVGLSIVGADELDEAAILRAATLRSGGPFHQRLLEQTLDVVRALYEEKGFESTQVSAGVGWDEEEMLADVEIRILEGPQSIIDRVIFRGQRRTRPSVLRRTAGLRSGEAFNTGRLLQAQRSLYGLGAFSRVEVRRAPGTPFKGERDVVVEVEEGSRHKITYGVGYNSEDGFSGLLGYTRSNLFGRGLSARVDARASERDNLGRVLVHQPYLGRFRLPTTGSLFHIESTEESFTSRRRGGQIGIERVGDHARVGLLYDYRNVQLLDLAGPLEELRIDRALQEVRVSSLTPSYQLDHRDDPVDPTGGWRSSIQLEYAFPFLAASENYWKAFGQYSHYVGLGRLGVLSGSLRLGAIEPISTDRLDPTVPEGEPSAFIPISERFFAGGRTTHRAYERDRLGIPGETLFVDPELDPDDRNSLVPIGGNGLLLLNLDYRFPIAGPVGGTLFVDAGNLWGDWRDIDPAEAKSGIGLGVRYLSPVGPIRLEIGWKLDRLRSEDPYVIFFSFGNPY